MAEIRVACPVCHTQVRVAEHMQGQEVHCPKCLSLVPLTRRRMEDDDDLAQPVEANYDLPEDSEEASSKSPQACPACGRSLPPQAKFCTKCGYHLAMETHFDELMEENLQRREEPKTKAERWLEENLHESASPRDVLMASAACCGVVALIGVLTFMAYFPVFGIILGIMFGGGLFAAWFFAARYLGLLEDPKRAQRLAKEGQTGPAPQTPPTRPDPADSPTPPNLTTPPPPPIPQTPAQPREDRPRPSREKPSPQAKPSQAAPQQATAGKPRSPQPPPKAASPTNPRPPKSQPAEDDWLNFFDEDKGGK